jgi:hypothetical protein
MAQTIKADGSIEQMNPSNGIDFSLKELQEAVGGYIEMVYLPNGIMVVNEEGLLKGLPLNQLASQLAGQPIVGNVLVCDREQIK